MSDRAVPILPADDLRIAKQLYVEKLDGILRLRRRGAKNAHRRPAFIWTAA